MNLYINACTRKDSRTRILANKLLEKIGDYEEIDLYSLDLRPIDEEFIKNRTELINSQKLNDKLFDIPNKIKKADNLIIAAPFWDNSFPSILKVFIENIYTTDLLTKFDDNGESIGLCKGNTVYYVTTAGGSLILDYGYKYIESIFVDTFGYKNIKLIKAEMLDIVGNDENEIMRKAIEDIEL